MSEETKTPPVDPAPNDEFKNFKAEVSRKLDNSTAQLQALMEQLKKTAAPTQSAPKSQSAEDVWFDDPKAAKQLLKEEVRNEIRTEMGRDREVQSKYQTVVSNIYNDYPEFNDESHELTKRAREIYSTFGDDDKNSPLALDAAARRAASELGYKPKAKRSTEDDTFALSGAKSGAKPSKPKEDIADATLMIAELMGRKTSDPKVKESLKKASSRKTWNRYE